MSELDRLLDAVMKSKADFIKQEAPEDEREALIAALREKQKNKIIDEIKAEYKDEIIHSANEELEKRANRKKIKDIRSLMWNGFFLAFIVGLAVNQVTELLGFWKGTISTGSLSMTVGFTVTLLLVCLLAYGYSFISNVLSLFDNLREERE